MQGGTMSRQLSFTKQENELLPKFRKMVNEAESTEDVRKFFVYCIQELCTQAFAGRVQVQFEDVGLLPEGQPPYAISEALRSSAPFAEVWQGSDLPQIIGRFAELAQRRYRHLAKNPEKTEAKIRMER
jgi:hypothetical protein